MMDTVCSLYLKQSLSSLSDKQPYTEKKQDEILDALHSDALLVCCYGSFFGILRIEFLKRYTNFCSWCGQATLSTR